MINYLFAFVYNIYIKLNNFPKYARLSNSRRPQGDSANTKCSQSAQCKQAKPACNLETLRSIPNTNSNRSNIINSLDMQLRVRDPIAKDCHTFATPEYKTCAAPDSNHLWSNNSDLIYLIIHSF